MTSHLPFRQSANASFSIPLRKLLKHKAKKTLQGFAIHKKGSFSVVSHALDYHFPHWDDIGLLELNQ